MHPNGSQVRTCIISGAAVSGAEFLKNVNFAHRSQIKWSATYKVLFCSRQTMRHQKGFTAPAFCLLDTRQIEIYLFLVWVRQTFTAFWYYTNAGEYLRSNFRVVNVTRREFNEPRRENRLPLAHTLITHYCFNNRENCAESRILMMEIIMFDDDYEELASEKKV